VGSGVGSGVGASVGTGVGVSVAAAVVTGVSAEPVRASDVRQGRQMSSAAAAAAASAMQSIMVIKIDFQCFLIFRKPLSLARML
jgi:hypothetical protein